MNKIRYIHNSEVIFEDEILFHAHVLTNGQGVAIPDKNKLFIPKEKSKVIIKNIKYFVEDVISCIEERVVLVILKTYGKSISADYTKYL